jgi:choline dehydrogenase-like flavoprotein
LQPPAQIVFMEPGMATERYDIIIIGTGAGGGTLAHRLAPTGKRILLLERADFLPRERDNWEASAVFVHAKYQAKEIWCVGTAARFIRGSDDILQAIETVLNHRGARTPASTA